MQPHVGRQRQAGRQPSTSTATARRLVGSVARTVPAEATGTCAYPTSAPVASFACTRQVTGRASGLLTVNTTVTDESVNCSTPVTCGWYGSPYCPYKRWASHNVPTTSSARPIAGSQRRARFGARRRPYRPGGKTGASLKVTASQRVSDGCARMVTGHHLKAGDGSFTRERGSGSWLWSGIRTTE